MGEGDMENIGFREIKIQGNTGIGKIIKMDKTLVIMTCLKLHYFAPIPLIPYTPKQLNKPQ
ncbi:MAG: hypothetical protein DRI89_06040 [Bacteroidetes bacterium]|nr:MAG: hypothetical protein DRI89_06040 [Bacteroidota bacterium]